MLGTINKFIEYWWFRYLMVTELYIVEKWERVTMRKFQLCVIHEQTITFLHSHIVVGYNTLLPFQMLFCCCFSCSSPISISAL